MNGYRAQLQFVFLAHDDAVTSLREGRPMRFPECGKSDEILDWSGFTTFANAHENKSRQHYSLAA
jgi:hypothetical protein